MHTYARKTSLDPKGENVAACHRPLCIKIGSHTRKHESAKTATGLAWHCRFKLGVRPVGPAGYFFKKRDMVNSLSQGEKA
jgi:hypothetical protein